MAVGWGYYDNIKFETLNKKYLPRTGEGETKATQIVTCLNKLVYRYYNDGDIFDNTYFLESYTDLTDYANWLYHHTTTEAKVILDEISNCHKGSDYEDLLKDLADTLFNEDYLTKQNKLEKVGTIYDCYGKFKFEEETENDYYDEEDEDYCY